MRWLVIACAICACESAPATDGGPDANPFGIAPPIAPSMPRPPEMACPDGWRDITPWEGASACDPWPAGGRHVCAEDHAHFPGAPGCERIGPPCAEDGWP